MAIQKIGATLAKYQQQGKTGEVARPKNIYISKETQLRALQLTQLYDDEDHKIQYLNLCKQVHPTIIEQAASFVSDANARKKGALFMWKVKQIKSEWQAAGKDWHHPEAKNQPAKKRKKKPVKPASLFD